MLHRGGQRAPCIGRTPGVRGVAGSVGTEQRVDLVGLHEVGEGRLRWAPQHLKMQAEVAQDVVLHATVQGRKAWKGTPEIVLRAGVEVNDLAHADFGHQILQFWRGQCIQPRLQSRFF